MIRNFRCAQGSGVEIPVEAGEVVRFPDAYCKSEDMVQLSRLIRKTEEAEYCVLPFCHTVEGEALGARVHYGDEKQGPRGAKPLYHSVTEALQMKQMDFSEGRIREVLLACEQLTGQGERVILNVAGPLTVLNTLVDSTVILKAFRKEKETVEKLLQLIGNELISYMRMAYNHGVRTFSFADSVMSVDILGPKVTEWLVDLFYGPFAVKLDRQLPEDASVLFCPKLSYALLDTDWAELSEYRTNWEEPVRYDNGCVRLTGQVRFMGITCMKNHSLFTGSTCKVLRLKQDRQKYND